jgi:hypothetical protein
MKKPWKVVSWNFPKIRQWGFCLYVWPWLEGNPVVAFHRTWNTWYFDFCRFYYTWTK